MLKLFDLKPTKFVSYRQNLPQTKAEKTIVENRATEILIIFQFSLATVVVILLEDYVSVNRHKERHVWMSWLFMHSNGDGLANCYTNAAVQVLPNKGESVRDVM